MSHVNGKIKNSNIRVFRWNKKMAAEHISKDQGFFMIRVRNTIQGQFHQTEQKQAYGFKYENFQSRQYIEFWVQQALRMCNFFSCFAVTKLKKEVPKHLLSYFRFPTNEEGPIKPMLVIVLDVSMHRTKGAIKSGPSAEKKQKITFGDPVDESEVARPDSEQLADWVRQYCDPELLGAVGEQPIVENEPQGLYQVEASIKVETNNCRSADEDMCPICFEKFGGKEVEVAKTPCSHIFHSNCLFEWLPEHGNCPICRAPCTTVL